MLKGGDSGQPAVVPGDPDHSPLIVAVRYNDAVKMPKKYRLKDEEIAVLAAWVQRGAPWPAVSGSSAIRTAGDAIRPEDRQFWSFRPVADPPLPAVKNPNWCKQPLDRFILAKLEEKGLHPVAPADKRTLIRRATFDLIGLPPTPEEIDAFLADDSPNAFAKVVDRLLASPHYGERWGRHWLDVARYGEDQAHTFQARLYPYGYRYRDWVVRAFNDDMPYDRFVTEQIAGDLLKTGDPTDHLPALGSSRLGPHYYMDAGEAKAAEAAELDDRVDTLGRGFLGLTVACARCHDHKFDPITTQDYYALAGVFTQQPLRRNAAGPAGRGAEVQRGAGEDQAAGGEGQGVPRRRGEEAGRDREEGRGQAAGRGEAEAGRAAGRAWSSSRRRRRRSRRSSTPSTDGPGENMHVYLHGNPNNEGPVVQRRFLRILSDGDPQAVHAGQRPAGAGPGHRQPEKPADGPRDRQPRLAMALRRGIVPTPSNFGKLGQPPTHPELLDHLATRFMAEGWSIKKLHREIMLSATYQLSSAADDADRKTDPANTFYWRMNRRRLDVEAWRDALLAAAGNLDPALGGPSTDLNAAGQPPPHALRRREPARPERPAPALRLPRPEHHGRETARDDGAAAAVVRPQQRVHGRAGARPGEAAGRRKGRRGEDPQGVPAALRPAGDGARGENGPRFPGRAGGGCRAERGETEAEPLGAVRPGVAGDE